mmetsp:Transcript_20194/g.48771  ORF Transcript_20194/g.48771 Transcript_20194/m.48771 type:complete len:261 (-) Transcript_20194:2748-3530(-)
MRRHSKSQHFLSSGGSSSSWLPRRESFCSECNVLISGGRNMMLLLSSVSSLTQFIWKRTSGTRRSLMMPRVLSSPQSTVESFEPVYTPLRKSFRVGVPALMTSGGTMRCLLPAMWRCWRALMRESTAGRCLRRLCCTSSVSRCLSFPMVGGRSLTRLYDTSIVFSPLSFSISVTMLRNPLPLMLSSVSPSSSITSVGIVAMLKPLMSSLLAPTASCSCNMYRTHTCASSSHVLKMSSHGTLMPCFWPSFSLFRFLHSPMP